MNQTVLNIDPQLFWGLITLGGFGISCVIAYGLMNTSTGPQSDPLMAIKRNLGLKTLNTGVFLVAAMLWLVILTLLGLGLIWLIWDVIWIALPDSQQDIWTLRFQLVKLTALTATLAAVVALPVTLQRLRLTRQQTDTATEALFNDKINAAADDLHARRQETREGDAPCDIWNDDIIRRNAAIDRLEGLARERPDTVTRIARMLGIYVRELSRENRAVPVPEGATPDALRNWAYGLPDCRSDMENAVQVLGRLQQIKAVSVAQVPINLRGANLQRFDLRRLRLEKANLSGAQMQGAYLSEAEMQGADLSGAEMDSATSLSTATLRGAVLREVDCTNIAFSQRQVDEIFYDGTVTFAPDISRAEGREERLEWDDFETRWRAWQDEIGFDRDNPGG